MIKLDNEDILRRLKHLPKTIECGLHSGFPPCCVAFYANHKIWMDNDERDAYNKRSYDKGVSVFYERLKTYTLPGDITDDEAKVKVQALLTDSLFGYVPCPSCLESYNKVTVLKCDCLSHAEEQAGEIFFGKKL